MSGKKYLKPEHAIWFSYALKPELKETPTSNHQAIVRLSQTEMLSLNYSNVRSHSRHHQFLKLWWTLRGDFHLEYLYGGVVCLTQITESSSASTDRTFGFESSTCSYAHFLHERKLKHRNFRLFGHSSHLVSVKVLIQLENKNLERAILKAFSLHFLPQ